MTHSKDIQKEMRQLVETAHDRELSLYLSYLEKRFAERRNGQIDPRRTLAFHP